MVKQKAARQVGTAEARPEASLLELIDRVYRAALERAAWQEVAAGLSEHFGGAAIWLAIQIPEITPPASVFRVGIRDDMAYLPSREEALISERIWKVGPEIGERFVRMSEYGGARLDTVIDDFMRPQGLAAEPPIMHVTAPERAMLSSLITIFRRSDGPPITEAQLAVADRLVPHLARAIEIHARLGGSENSQIALHEVIDRIPTGILIVDDRRLPVITNRMADRIIASGDGFTVDDDGPRGRDGPTTAKLRQLIDSAAQPPRGREFSGGGFMALERKSGRRPYPVMVTPIIGRPEHSSLIDAAALIFISDPEIRDVSIVNVLMEMYGLTPAEAELAQILSHGMSLEDAARLRHVTLNTARSQLKQIFAKTDTRRQGELLQLVLSGVASIDADAEVAPGAPAPDGIGPADAER